MYQNTPSRSSIRLTRRGRLALIATGAVVAGTAVAVPLLSLQGEREKEPTTLVIPEGWRAGQIYDAVDKALARPPGTAKKSLAKAKGKKLEIAVDPLRKLRKGDLEAEAERIAQLRGAELVMR